MSTANGVAGKGQGNCPSSLPSSSPDAEEELRTYGLIGKGLKLKLADHARLMRDNQAILNLTAAEDRALRQQRQRLRRHQVDQAIGSSEHPDPALPEGEPMGDINIDSPTVIHQYPPPQKRPLGWLGKAAIAAGLVGAGALGPVGLGLMHALSRPAAATRAAPPAAAPADQDTDSWYELRLMPK